MTAVPPPDIPCVRVRLIYNKGSNGESGNRFYLSYSGSAPTAGNCTTLATDIANAWNTNLAPIIAAYFTLEEVDVLDIATDAGASGVWTGSHEGTKSGTSLPVQCAQNIQLEIARRYRGGKPRLYLPPPTEDTLNDQSHYQVTWVDTSVAAVEAFFAAVVALSVGSIGTLQHVNLSYYQGFKNITNSSGRERAVPQYRTTAKSDPITGYVAETLIGSQRRRRASTSP